MLPVLHPAVADRDCVLCQKYQYNEETGQVERRANGSYRPRATPPRCRTKRGCPKGTPENPKTLWPRNRQAYEFYLECRATGNFPADPFVAETARLIADAQEEAREVLKAREDNSLGLFKVLSNALGSNKGHQR